MRRLSEDLHEHGDPPLRRAFEKLVNLPIADLAPTAFTMPLSLAYTETEGYLVQRVRRRVQRLADAGDRLLDSHQSWKAAERASTIDPRKEPGHG